jgi:hypothetical protein
MPASWNAAVSSGLSAVSQRTEDSVSGRITPTLPVAGAELLAPPAEVVLPPGAGAVTGRRCRSRPARPRLRRRWPRGPVHFCA